MSNGFLQGVKETPGETQLETPSSAPVEAPAEAPSPSLEESTVKADERLLEQLPEFRDDFFGVEKPAEAEQAERIEAGGVAAPVAPVATTAKPPRKKDDVVVRVEKILEEGLGDYFDRLPDQAKTRFRMKGEDIAFEIAAMVRSFRVKVKKALSLIHDWLLTIPGVNKYFLEQEAKIKTDRILALEQSVKEERQNRV